MKHCKSCQQSLPTANSYRDMDGLADSEPAPMPKKKSFDYKPIISTSKKIGSVILSCFMGCIVICLGLLVLGPGIYYFGSFVGNGILHLGMPGFAVGPHAWAFGILMLVLIACSLWIGNELRGSLGMK